MHELLQSVLYPAWRDSLCKQSVGLVSNGPCHCIRHWAVAVTVLSTLVRHTSVVKRALKNFESLCAMLSAIHPGLRSFALVGPVGHYDELSLRLFPRFALLVTVVDFAHTVRSSNALLLVVRLYNRRAPQQVFYTCSHSHLQVDHGLVSEWRIFDIGEVTSCAPAKRPPVHRTYAFKQEALQAWDELKWGGTTLVHYCRARKIPVSTFEKWLIKKDEIASVCTADVNKHVLSLQTNKPRKKSKKRKKLCVDSRHQELHEWLVAAPKPLYTGAMRDKVRALWPEWSDEDHPECKTPHYLAKWCRRVAVRFVHTAGSTASSSEASQASSGDDGDFWEDEGSQTQPGDEGDFWVGVAIPDGEILAAKRQRLCPETMVHTGTTGGHEYVRQPHRKRIMHPIANDDIARDDFLDDYHFDALLAPDSFSAPSSSSCDRVVARATATRQTRSVPPSSQESTDARAAKASHKSSLRHGTCDLDVPHPLTDLARRFNDRKSDHRQAISSGTECHRPPTPAQNESQCCIAGHAAVVGEDCFIESEIRRKYLELDAYFQSTTQGEVPPVRSDYAPCATAHTQSKPKGRKTTQTGPRSSPQPIRTTPNSSAAKPAPNDPSRSRVLGHMTPYATLTGPHLSPTSTHAAPASTVTKPTTNPLPNTDNEGHREDPPPPS
ncbi:hypothetical protein H257_07772 [Aphanomyces astaci]|uniref:Uncharacterized protein n=1 Tax=Aphanomyces astaci TaxID=112090 RepID=W4GIX9_APHAT|nr:hypothetical protein H257_07772 [Aphanomyces astaci]ETV78984.1 hypothetical protein H257_07772 [Aphanomyces astaci]|eukprot:XP_009831703.1 hypothetical protein H257_07772 [Aphanomyces astaci]